MSEAKYEQAIEYIDNMSELGNKFDSEGKLLTTETDTEQRLRLGVMKEPGAEKKTFLRMLKKESLEYIIDMFYDLRTISKKQFIELVKSTSKSFGPDQREIAERCFESIDLTE